FEPNGAHAMALDTHGNLFVSNDIYGRVDVFAPGSTTPSVTLSGLNQPSGLAFDPYGNLYVADSGDNTVSVFALAYDVQGNLLPGSTSPGYTINGLSGPQALAVDAAGNAFVMENGASVSVVASTPSPAAGGVVVRTAQPDEPITLGAASGAGLSLSD